MPNENLQTDLKQDWYEREVVMPEHVNDWSSRINKINEIIPTYSATGSFYKCSFEDNTYKLSPMVFADDSQNVAPTSYIDGMQVEFKIAETNETNCLVDVNGLGAKTIKNTDNTVVEAEKLEKNDYVTLRYDYEQDCFYIVTSASKQSGAVTEVTNCLLKVPQTINLEIVDGELVLKKGSTFILPNGAGNFDRITTTKDLKRATFGSSTRDDMYIQIHIPNSTGEAGLSFCGPNVVTIGTEQPESGKMWYDTTNNKIYNVGSTGLENALRSFPIAVVSLEAGVPVKINKVFNGFGNFGGCYFNDIGVKFLNPYGRNQDRTLKNREYTTTVVRTSFPTGNRYNQSLVIAPEYFGPQAGYRYDEFNNYNYRSVSGSEGPQATALVGHTSVENGIVTQFDINEPFRAVDYNEYKKEIIELSSRTQIPIGMIFQAIRKDIPANCLRLDGTEITNGFEDFVNEYLATNKIVSKTYTEWQTEYDANDGNVGFFAYDSDTGKFKTPSIQTGTFLAQAITSGEFGSFLDSSIKSHTHSVSITTTSSGAHTHTFQVPEDSGSGGSLGKGMYNGPGNVWSSDYTTASSGAHTHKVSGNTGAVGSTDTYPKHIRYPFFVVVANKNADKASQADWDNFVGNLDGKVNKSGDTMTGWLSVQQDSAPTFQNICTALNVTDAVAPSSNLTAGRFVTRDNNGTITSELSTKHLTNNQIEARLGVYRIINGATKQSNLFVGVRADGTSYVTAPTPATNDNSTHVATTAWVNNMKSTITGWNTPNYSAGVSVATGGTIAKNGIIVVQSVCNSGYGTVSINSVQVFNAGPSANTETSASYIVSKGDVIVHNVRTVTFYPFKGV